MNAFDLTDKHIAITGASSGFGHHFAGVLGDGGARLSLGARRTDKIDHRVAELNGTGMQAIGAPLDVRNADSIKAFLRAAEEAHGHIDVLINNAGVEAGAKTYLMIDETDWDFVIDTNLKGSWLTSKFYTEGVLENQQDGGNIINISSITDTRTIKGQFPYAVSKGALTRMTQVMALEAAKYNIRVNALAPGYILTDVSRIPESSYALLDGVDVLVLNALRARPHPTHLTVEGALIEAQRIGARRTLLTHMSHELSHAETSAQLPPGVELAYDGLVLELE